jgi:hypothetical protein
MFKIVDSLCISDPAPLDHRIMEDGRAGYCFTATGTFERLLTSFNVANENGGGQPTQPSLLPLLRFEIHGVALVA